MAPWTLPLVDDIVLLTKLDDDLLSLVLCHLPLAHDIVRAQNGCSRLKRGAELAFEGAAVHAGGARSPGTERHPGTAS